MHVCREVTAHALGMQCGIYAQGSVIQRDKPLPSLLHQASLVRTRLGSQAESARTPSPRQRRLQPLPHIGRRLAGAVAAQLH